MVDVRTGHDKRLVIEQNLLMIAGNLIFALGVNIIITPLGLYNGGFMGISQLLRYFAVEVLHISFLAGIDLVGIIYFLLNVPLIYMGYKTFGREYCINTLIAIAVGSAFLSLVPIPKEPIIGDTLTGCLIGGVVAGSGAGMVMRGGRSGGGQDIIGSCLSVTHPNWSVGGISIAINFCVYAVCFFVWNIEVVIYSLIYTTVLAIFLDRMFVQNINVQAMIITKSDDVADAILYKLKRGATEWDGIGSYTGDQAHVLMTVLSKYEVPTLIRLVHEIDPNAFITIHEKAQIYGNFQKRLVS
ncbi:MAG: YitT family protein [Mogibacterium sp.]|nr:YitT family protein [Mogibacterium sp.]MBR2539899.1 YitT family protein [Mogibacterium sp.]